MEQKYFLAIVGIITALAVVSISACVASPKADNAPTEKYCEVDADCACGVHTGTTGNCFYGNKKYVNTLQQCPDFCTGIAGNLGIKCVDNGCEQVSVRQN